MSEQNKDIQELEAEIKRLTVELEETNAILELREEELKAVKRDEQAIAELYSLLSDKDIEVESMKQKIAGAQRRADAAINFQEEMLGDFDLIKKIQKENQELHTQIAELQSNAEDYELQIMRLQKKVDAGSDSQLKQLQIELENLQLENLRLKNKISRLEGK